MTNQEAIERLQEAYYILCEDDYFLNPMREAFDMAISALQAQDSKTRRICDTCKYNQPSKKWPCVDCDMREHADRWEPQDVPDINVGDMISRHAAIDAVSRGCKEFRGIFADCEKNLNELPSTQPETARRIVGKSRGGMTLWYQCDMCNEPVDKRDIYCRGCGRRFVDE